MAPKGHVMRSLRTRLLVSTWIAVAAAGLLSAVVTFFVARHESEVLLDGQMRRVALVAATGQIGSVPTKLQAAPPPRGYELEDDLIVEVRDLQGRLLYCSHPDLSLPLTWSSGYASLGPGSSGWRSYGLQTSDRRVRVLQPLEVRRESAAGAALAALLPVALIIPALGLIISLQVRRQTGQVARAAEQIATRPPLSLEALPVDSLPTEVQPLISELNRLLDRIREASAREQRFVADSAHALRTPLTALRLQADVLDGSIDPGERQRRVQELRAGIGRVVRLSTQLLDLARHEREPGPGTESDDLAEVLQDVVALYAPVASRQHVSVQVRYAESAFAVRADGSTLQLILGNLLDNAIRYSPLGGEVNIQLQPRANVVEVRIVDAGPGIPEEHLPHVFERFFRVPGDGTSGNGLGLATVAAAAQRIGATVVLENRTESPGLLAIVGFARVL